MQPVRVSSRAIAVVALAAGVFSFVHAVRVEPDPLTGSLLMHANIIAMLLPAALAASVAAGASGIARVLAIVGAAIAGLGWIIGLLPASLSYDGSMAIMELLGPDGFERVFDAASMMVGVGLAVALGGSAIPDQPIAPRIGAGIGAVLAIVGPAWTLAAAAPPVDPQLAPPSAPLSLFVLPLGMVVFGVSGLIGGKSETAVSNPTTDAQAWLTVAGGARSFGVALALFMLAGMAIGRLAGVDDRKVQQAVGLLGQLATVGLLSLAAWGLRGMAKSPDPGTRSLAGVGLAGALTASIGAGAIVLLVAAAAAGVLHAPFESVVGERSPMGAAAWFVALAGLCIAAARIGQLHRWTGLTTLALVTLGFLALGSFAQAIPPMAFERFLGGATEAAPFIGAGLTLPGLFLGLALTSKVAKSLTDTYGPVATPAPPPPQYGAGYPAR